MLTKTQAAERLPTLTVLYNGGCSICAPEISGYQKLADRAGVSGLDFVDISPEVLAGTRDPIYLKRFHVAVNGSEVSGIRAFIHLWDRLPYFKIVSKFISLPIIYHLASWIYERVAAPWLYRRFMRSTKQV